MTKSLACLRATILALVAALVLSPALLASSASASTTCQSATAQLAKSQHALSVARAALAKQKKALAKAKKQHRKAAVKKQRKLVRKRQAVVNTRSAQVRRDTSARSSACATKPPTSSPQGTQTPAELGTLVKLLGSIGGGVPTVLASTADLQTLLNGFQAGLGDQFDPTQLTEMLAGYQAALPTDPAALASLLGTQWDASQVTALLASSPVPTTLQISQVAETVAVLLDTLAGSGFTPPSTLDVTVLSSLLNTLLGGGGGIITLPPLPPLPCVPLLTC